MKTPEGHITSAYAQTLGCRFIEVGEGQARVALELQPHLHNRAQQMHGGAIFGLIDSAMGMACSSAHGFDRQSSTIECKINYIRGVSQGEVLCTAKVLHAGRRTLVVEAEVTQGDKLIAKAQGTFAQL
jgi:uncharacterized protein (TIGR00369 family)